MSVIAREDLRDVSRSLQKAGKRIVFTNGCFDLLHPGHCSLLEEASRHGEILVVGINDDASVERLKGAGRPVTPAEERAELLLALRWVDHVTVFPEDTPLETIELIVPDVLVKGSEYSLDNIVGAAFVVEHGGEVVRVAMKDGHSSRNLIKKISGIS
jgi:rfaE bifunctional protein nucleotidyltransferase chain/domain